MINPKDLRQGNLVKYTGVPYPSYPLKDGIVKVEEVLSDGVNRSQGDSTLYEADKLEGVPLNTEWLERCGFKQDGPNWAYNGFRLLRYKDDLVYGVLNQVVNYTPIVHVHQLQNLYFATCLHELTIKETV